MPRPIRISYPNAFYHIMNRGRGRQNIFHAKEYFLTFLNILSEAHQRFGCIVHAYCLMSNHYHLIIETPNANLSRIMRHINGVYTQRYNKLKKTDGPLFRGRFKAIVVDEESNYFLQLSRYIHRNPISTKNNLVKNLKDYEWSSYPAFLNLCQTPIWLSKTKTLGMFEGNNTARHEAYVEDLKENPLQELYNKKTLPSVVGDKEFKKKISNKVSHLSNDDMRRSLNDHVTKDEVVAVVAKVFKIEVESILASQIGRRRSNFPRKLAMYLCQKYCGNSLVEIKNYFNLKSLGGVSNAIFSVKRELGKYQEKFEIIKSDLMVIQ